MGGSAAKKRHIIDHTKEESWLQLGWKKEPQA